MSEAFDAEGFALYVNRRLDEFFRGEHMADTKASEPHKVSEPMNELDYYREVQRLSAENAVFKDTIRYMAENAHQAYHHAPDGWWVCPKNICTAAQQQLPDYVLWLKGEGPKP